MEDFRGREYSQGNTAAKGAALLATTSILAFTGILIVTNLPKTENEALKSAGKAIRSGQFSDAKAILKTNKTEPPTRRWLDLSGRYAATQLEHFDAVIFYVRSLRTEGPQIEQPKDMMPAVYFAFKCAKKLKRKNPKWIEKAFRSNLGATNLNKTLEDARQNNGKWVCPTIHAPLPKVINTSPPEPEIVDDTTLTRSRRVASGSSYRSWMWGMLGGAGVATAVGLRFGLEVRSNQNDEEQERSADIPSRDTIKTHLSAKGRNAMIANIAYGVAGASLLSAGILYLVEPPESSARVVLTPVFSQSHMGLAGTF